MCELILPSFHFPGLHYGLILRTSLQRNKIRSSICGTVHRNELYTALLYSGYLLPGTCCRKSTVKWHWLKFFRARFFCISARLISAAVKCVTNGRWTGQPSPNTVTLNGFPRNAKHGFNSWKCSDLAWNSSSRLKIYFSILPLCGLQLPLPEKHSFSFWHWKNDGMLLTIRVFENF